MQPDKPSGGTPQQPADERPGAQPRSGNPPKPDLQPEDAGTPASGQDASHSTPAAPAEKQTSKTDAESGRR